jgi:hypothetical protein
MKVFDKVENFECKVNFVDGNNVFVGYDTGQCCCEHAGYFVSDQLESDLSNEEKEMPNLEGYFFDINYIKYCDDKNNELDSGRMVAFRMVHKDKEDLFLHIFNSHNGYYSHGFEFKNGDEVIEEDYI